MSFSGARLRRRRMAFGRLKDHKGPFVSFSNEDTKGGVREAS